MFKSSYEFGSNEFRKVLYISRLLSVPPVAEFAEANIETSNIKIIHFILHKMLEEEQVGVEFTKEEFYLITTPCYPKKSKQMNKNFKLLNSQYKDQ